MDEFVKHRIVQFSEIATSPGLRLDADYYLNTTTINPKVGDRISYRGGWGRGPLTEATVTELGENKDQPIVSLDDGHWAYLYQIEAIL